MTHTRWSLYRPDVERPAPQFRGEAHWPYSRGEILADGLIHAVGLVLVFGGSIVLLAAVHARSAPGIAAVAVYLATLCASFAASAAYNLWPPSRWKWLIRRLDQSAIYLLIAGTYTPLFAALGACRALAAVWAFALIGVALRIARPDRFDRLAIALYLLIGWSGVAMIDDAIAGLPERALWLIVAGGLTYTSGVVFHVWSRLRFQNAIWHAFVLVAAAIHYAAIWIVATAPA